ncbi:hypothetical protein Hanom_Chr11g01026161 [Helianthus anomalus]
MFTPFCRRCPLAQKLTNFVLKILKSYTYYPLGQAQLDFLVNSDYTNGILVFLPISLILIKNNTIYFKNYYYI